MTSPPTPSDPTPLYRELRKANAEMVNKLLDATRPLDFSPLRMAKRMTLRTSGRTLIFQTETEQYAFFDFWLHEYRVDGRSLVEHVDPAAANLSPLEVDLLQSHRDSRTSLFEILSVDPQRHQVRLRDVLEPNKSEVLITDIGWSESMRVGFGGPVVFVRPLTARGISMTGGFSFGFKPERAKGLLQAYGQRMKKVPPAEAAEQRFIFFFQKNREIGEEQTYADVRAT